MLAVDAALRGEQKLAESLLTILQGTPRLFFMEDVLANRCRDIAQTVGFEFETTVCLA